MYTVIIMAISILRKSFYALTQKFPVAGMTLEKSAQEPTEKQIYGSFLGDFDFTYRW